MWPEKQRGNQGSTGSRSQGREFEEVERAGSMGCCQEQVLWESIRPQKFVDLPPTPPMPWTSGPKDLPFTHKFSRKTSMPWVPLTNPPTTPKLPLRAFHSPMDTFSLNPAC